MVGQSEYTRRDRGPRRHPRRVARARARGDGAAPRRSRWRRLAGGEDPPCQHLSSAADSRALRSRHPRPGGHVDPEPVERAGQLRSELADGGGTGDGGPGLGHLPRWPVGEPGEFAISRPVARLGRRPARHALRAAHGGGSGHPARQRSVAGAGTMTGRGGSIGLQAALIATGTWLGGWWAVPAIAAGWRLLRRGEPAWTAGAASLLGWGTLLSLLPPAP